MRNPVFAYKIWYTRELMFLEAYLKAVYEERTKTCARLLEELGKAILYPDPGGRIRVDDIGDSAMSVSWTEEESSETNALSELLLLFMSATRVSPVEVNKEIKVVQRINLILWSRSQMEHISKSSKNSNPA